MKKFKPQSPNPNIKKPADATLAVLGQLNKLVEEKADISTVTSTIFDIYPFEITPVLIKLEDKLITGSTSDDFINVYKLTTRIWIDNSYGSFGEYLGSIEYKSEEGCPTFLVNKIEASTTAYDGEVTAITSFGVGSKFYDPANGGFPLLTNAAIDMESYTYQDESGTWYQGHDIFLDGDSLSAAALRAEVQIDLFFYFRNFCSPNNELNYHLYL